MDTFVSDADVAHLVARFLARSGCARARSCFMKEAKHLFSSDQPSNMLKKYSGLKDILNACFQGKPGASNSVSSPHSFSSTSSSPSLPQLLNEMIDRSLSDTPKLSSAQQEAILSAFESILKIIPFIIRQPSSSISERSPEPSVASEPTQSNSVSQEGTSRSTTPIEETPPNKRFKRVLLQSPNPTPNPGRACLEGGHLLSYPSHSVDPFYDDSRSSKFVALSPTTNVQFTASEVLKNSQSPSPPQAVDLLGSPISAALSLSGYFEHAPPTHRSTSQTGDQLTLEEKGTRLLKQDPEELLARFKRVKRKTVH